MATVGKLTQQGELQLSGTIDTRLPLVTDGLVAHYPMDGAGGTFDMISGNQSLQNTSSGVNLIEAMNNDWRDPSSWVSNYGMIYDSTMDAMKVTGYHNTWLKIPVVVNTSMHYEISIDIMETIQSSIGLYLGGYSLDSAGVLATNNYDYTMASNDQPATGVWKTYRLTRTGTAVAGSGTSTSFSTVKGWTGDAGRLIKYYHFGGLLNYSSGGVLYFRNPSIRVIDPDTSNTTITNDYIAIEEATTNVITNTNLDTGWSKSYCTDILWNDIPPPHGIDAQVVSFKDLDGSGSGYWFCYGDYAPQSPNTTYTISVYARTFGSDASIFAYTADNGEVGRQLTNTLTVPGNGEWIRLVFNAITTPSNTQSDSLSFNISSFPADQRLWLCAPQMEAKSYATEYVNGSRGSSKLTIPNPVKTGDYTISYEWRSTSPIGTTASYQTSFQIGNYSTNNSFTIMDTGSGTTTGTQRLIREGDGGQWNWLTGDLTTPSTVQEWTTITIVRNSSNYRVYSNGVYKGEIAHYAATMQDLIHIGSREVWRAGENSFTRNLSIYNRALSDDEVKKLVKGTHSITSAGLISKHPIVSEARRPSEANYFPFDLDGKDYYKSILPTKDEATEYVDGSVWVGRGTTNILNASGYDCSLERSGTGYSYTNRNITTYILANWTASNNKISIQFEGKRDYFDGTDGYPRMYIYFTDWTWSASFGITSYDWTHGKLENVTMPDPTGKTVYFAIYHYTSGSSGLSYSRNTQMEFGTYCTPFVNGTRAQSSLHLPYNIIDCKQDFTIYGWWYPTIYADGVYRPCLTRNIPDSNNTNNRILIMGNATTSYQLRTWLSSGGSAELYNYSSVNVAVNEWNFFCLRRSGNITNLAVGNATNGFGISSDLDIGTTLNNDETGQVWQVGEYADNESDAYHRDYVFYQGAMSDDEIEAVFKNKMKATGNGLYIQNGVSSDINL